MYYPDENPRYGRDDIGISTLFCDLFRDSILRCIEQNCWYAYDGTRWVESTGKAMESCKAFTQALSSYYIAVAQLDWTAFPPDEHEQKKGMKNLIVDLQGNGGGYLVSAIAMADEFLGDGQSIVYTEGRRSPRDDAFATKQGLFQRGKLVLLVDESSASASEILSGAVQDWDRGVIVGRRTFGKGLVQRPIPFPDGSMIRLTVARYYTPSGRSIQKPYDKGHEAYERELLDRFNHGELVYTDSIHFPDSLQFKTLKNKRTVYGGGGIMPDVFVPLDTTIYTDFHRDLLAKGVLNQYPVNYLDEHRKELVKQYKDIERFAEGFVVTDEMLADLLKLGEAEKVKYDEEQYQKSRALIALQVKALIARDMFDTAAYFRIMNPENALFTKAMEIINDDVEYNRLLQPRE